LSSILTLFTAESVRQMAEIEVNDVGRPLPTISRGLFNFRFSAIFRRNGKGFRILSKIMEK
jgi:hypothetical protein